MKTVGCDLDTRCHQTAMFEKWPPDSRHHLDFTLGGRSFASPGPLVFFIAQTTVTAVTDTNPSLRDNEELIRVARGNPVHQDGPRNCPKPISALFDNLSPYSRIL